MTAWTDFSFGFSHLYFSTLNWQSKQAGQTSKYLRDLNENARFLVNYGHF